jgi:hypothetical protein
MQPENYFELRAQLLSVDQANSSSDFYYHVEDDAIPIRLQVWVDAFQIEEGVAVDFLGVLDTTHKLKQSNWKPFWGPSIFNCGCGNPGCAGMSESVEVHHDGEYVMWHARLPLKDSIRTLEQPDGVEIHFRFLKSQMIEACQSFVADARKASNGRLDRIRIPIHKESLDVLLRTSRYKWARKRVTPMKTSTCGLADEGNSAINCM